MFPFFRWLPGEKSLVYKEELIRTSTLDPDCSVQLYLGGGRAAVDVIMGEISLIHGSTEKMTIWLEI